MTTTVKSYCRTCPAGCGMEFDVEGNTILSYRRDFQHPLSEGHFCVKGRMSVDLVRGAEGRLLHSQERQANGSFTDVAASTALDRIAERLSEIIDRYGPRSVAVFQGTGGYYDTLGSTLLKGFLSALGTPNYFTTMTIDQSGKWVTMGRLGMMMSGKRQLAATDVAMVVGNNSLVSHQAFPYGVLTSSNPEKHVERFKARGGKLIVVDPRRTETAEYADLHLQPYAGEDAVLFAGIVKHVLDNGWEDKAFCERFAIGMDRLREALAPFDLDTVAQRSGVPSTLIAEAAELYGKAARRSAACGTGPSMGPWSNLADHLIEVLNLVCGGYMKAGEEIANVGAMAPRPFVEEVLAPNRTWEREPKLPVSGAGQIFGEFPAALLPTEIGGPEHDRIRALIVYAGNPALALGEPDTTVEALRSLDLLVTIDARMTDTGKLSDYVIAPSLPFERHDTTSFFDSMFWRTFAQMATPVVSKPDDVVHDWEVFWGLASRMNKQLVLKNTIFGLDFDLTPGGVELDMNTPPDPAHMMRALCGDELYETLCSHPGGWVPDWPPTIVQEAETDSGARLDIMPPDVADELAALSSHETAVEFRYRLATRRLLHTSNSAFRDAKPTRTRYPTNRAWLHPDDMEADGLHEGDLLDIRSAHGKIVGVAASDDSVRRGVLSMAHLWGSIDPQEDPYGTMGAHTGRLVSLASGAQTINHMPIMTGIPVDISRR